MDRHLSGQVALVTGASRGIGRAIAIRLASRGAKVACVATAAERCEDTVAACRERDVDARAYGVDVASTNDVKTLVEQVVADLGGLHLVINNAGITRDQLMLRMSEEDFDRVVAVNLKGTWNFAKASARTLLKCKGRLINISSVVGVVGNAGQANYAASKAGVIGLTKSLAKEFAGRGVCVNAIAPGFIQTDMTAAIDEKATAALTASIPLGSLGEVEHIAAAVDYLAGPGGDYVTGQTLVVDGGMSL